MSVLIKGMKMPKACINCDVHIAHDYCDHFAQFGTGPRKDGRYDDCPLIEIPTPHGRLIDEGALICRMDDSFRMAGLHGADYRKVKRWLKNAQTILEAEE